MTLILSGTDGLSDIDGSAATPAIRGTDANTGIFFPAADTIAFAEGGVEVARFDSSSNFGLGTSSPIALLDVNGTSIFRNAQYGYQPTPTSLSGNTTLSVAQLLTQIIVLTGALTITMPTGTTLDSGLPANFPNNGSFDFTLIDTDPGQCSLAANTGVTIVGSGAMDVNSSASFRLRKTGTATYVVYRLA